MHTESIVEHLPERSSVPGPSSWSVKRAPGHRPGKHHAWNAEGDPLEQAPPAVQRAWQKAKTALQSENFLGAKEALTTAAMTAKGLGDLELERRIHAGRLALEFELGQPVEIAEVRALLAAAETLATTTVSAYLLGCIFEERRAWRKALFYARAALTSAESAGRPHWRAVANNLVGNVLLAQSYFEEATAHYQKVLLTSETTSLERAQASDNLGFALTAQGLLCEARPHLANALWRLRSVQGPARLSIELDLALYHVLNGEFQRSLRFAHAALERADDLGDRRGRANALLLLSESAKASNNAFLTRRCLGELSELYDAEFAAALSTFDVLELINLKA